MAYPTKDRPATPYRSRHGVLFGVCAGLAAYFDFSVFWLRVFVIIGFIMTGFWPVGIAYLVAALVMKPAPVVPFETDDDAEFYQSYTSSRRLGLQRLKRTYDSLDRRLQRIESIVTDREYDWDRRLNS